MSGLSQPDLSDIKRGDWVDRRLPRSLRPYVDIRDDKRLGLKSTAILFGVHGKAAVGLFYGLAVTAWAVGGFLAGMTAPYALGIAVISAHLGWQAWRLDLTRPDLSFRLFLANIGTGILLALAAYMGTW